MPVIANKKIGVFTIRAQVVYHAISPLKLRRNGVRNQQLRTFRDMFIPKAEDFTLAFIQLKQSLAILRSFNCINNNGNYIE